MTKVPIINQWTVFYMIMTSVMNELNVKSVRGPASHYCTKLNSVGFY